MFVVKTPKRVDFCGCPPCPLCYDWVEPAPPVQVQQAEQTPEPVVMTGVEKMALDLLGRAPNAEERKIMKAAAERVHEANVLRNKEQAAALEARADADREQNITRTVEGIIKAKTKEREAEKAAKPRNFTTVDNMDPEKVKELCGATAPVDVELLTRENTGKKKLTEKEKIQAEYERLSNLKR